jgi:hypothetical protein
MRRYLVPIVVAVIVLALIFGVVAFCSNRSPSATSTTQEVDREIDTGVIISKTRRSVTVREDDGEIDKHTVSKAKARNCKVGERWPGC